jgi:hypothetical protein
MGRCTPIRCPDLASQPRRQRRQRK